MMPAGVLPHSMSPASPEADFGATVHEISSVVISPAPAARTTVPAGALVQEISPAAVVWPAEPAGALVQEISPATPSAP
ncbi:hypothetical protein [Streptomyces sp. NPDC059092]|uniref:hypothetical protein n=1 Tax=Streptomyces sp. NPDC059092 TaxID=3346725 RepID=UPI0036740B13